MIGNEYIFCRWITPYLRIQYDTATFYNANIPISTSVTQNIINTASKMNHGVSYKVNKVNIKRVVNLTTA